MTAKYDDIDKHGARQLASRTELPVTRFVTAEVMLSLTI
jgi:hypothetical protein